MYRVAVCDDVERDLAEMAAVTAGLLKESGVEPEIQRFRSAAELMSAHQCGGIWDLILLDIIMDGQDGIQVAEALRAGGDETDLVFVSRSPEYALAGYRAYPVNYLLKPLTPEKLEPVLLRCLERRHKLSFLVLDAMGGGKITVLLGAIRYIEVFRRELVVHTGNQSISCTGPLNTVIDKLPAENFYRCHRSYIINLGKVSGIQKYQFLLWGGEEVPIAMRSYPEAQARWLEFLK